MIRYARPADHAAIAAVIAAAFGRADEADLVARLRADEDVMFELVAEEAGEVVGHILFSRLWADRSELYAALAPAGRASRPAASRPGLGPGPRRPGMRSASSARTACWCWAHPAYYPRFGFSAAAAAQVRAPYAGSPAFMALALEQDAFARPLSVAYPDAFAG